MANCQVCESPNRAQIELSLCHGISSPVLARRYGVSAQAVWRHKTKHLSPQQFAAIKNVIKPTAADLDALKTSESERLLSELVLQRARLQAVTDIATEVKDARTAVSVERAITFNLQLVAQICGKLVSRHEVSHTALMLSPAYVELRQAIIAALRPFPEAARAVGAALHQLESTAADDIKERAAAGRPLLLEASPV